jgi:hypothetical protein
MVHPALPLALTVRATVTQPVSMGRLCIIACPLAEQPDVDTA